MAQTLRCKIHNLIQLSKLLATSWAVATHAVPSACIPRNLDQRGDGSATLLLHPRASFRASSCFGISSGPPFIFAFHTSGVSVYRTPTDDLSNIEFWLLDRWPCEHYPANARRFWNTSAWIAGVECRYVMEWRLLFHL